jgi:hypothetical protein
MINNVNQIKVEIDQEYEDREYSDYYTYENNIEIGNNFAPLGIGILILIFALLYTAIAWPISFPVLRGKRSTTEFPDTLPNLMRNPTSHRIFLVLIIIVIVILASSNTYIYVTAPRPDDKSSFDDFITDPSELPREHAFQEFNGYSDEGTEYYEYLSFNDTCYIYCMNVTLEWFDEPDETRRHENQPDEFLLALYAPNGESYESDWVYCDDSGYGAIGLTTSLIDPPLGWEEFVYDNEWVIMVACGHCGDHEARFFGLLQFSDNGNNWRMMVDIDYCYESE